MTRPIMIVGGMTLLVALAACGGDDGGRTTANEDQAVIDPGDGGDCTVTIDPERFTSLVDNPYLPKLPGTTWEYIELTGDGDGGTPRRTTTGSPAPKVPGKPAWTVHSPAS